MNLYHYFKNMVLRFPDKTAVCFQEKRYSYLEFDERIRRLAFAMKRYGITAGKRIGIISTNSSAYVEITIAAAMLGAVNELFNWRITADSMAELVAASSAELIFFSNDQVHHYQKLQQSLARPVAFILTNGILPDCISYEALLEEASPLEEAVELPYSAPAFIYYTSGTTSLPKPVILSLGNIYQHHFATIYEVGWREEDVFLHSLPLFHTSASGVLCTLMTGGTVIILSHFDKTQWLQIARQEHVTCAGLVSNTIDWLSDSPEFNRETLPSIRWLIYAGSPMPYPVLKKAVARMGHVFIQLYGMTEMSPTVAILTPRDHERFLSAGRLPLPNGRPLFGARLQVVDEQDRPCPPYAEGEVIVQSETMMLGYDKQPELTAQVIRKGWYHTGDMGYLDESQYLYLVGRKNRMIITGGENVYPVQVETCIRSMGSDIEDVAVLGIPDPKWGETVAAVVVLKPESPLTESSIIDYCRDHLPGYMKPRRIRLAPRLPYNESGKVEYQALQEAFL